MRTKLALQKLGFEAIMIDGGAQIAFPHDVDGSEVRVSGNIEPNLGCAFPHNLPAAHRTFPAPSLLISLFSTFVKNTCDPIALISEDML